MVEFLMKVAGHTAKVTALFDSTPFHFSRYRTEEPAEFSIAVTPEDLEFEQADADQEAKEEGFRRREFAQPFLERAAIQRKFAEFLLYNNIVLVHGSTVAVDGRAYLFTARSGTGKSTHTRLWREVFGDRAAMVNDDKPFLELTETGIIAHGSPWSGKHGLDTNISVPLQGICLLERGSEDRIRRAEPDELEQLLRGFRPTTEEQAASYDALLKQLLSRAALWQMDCTKNPSAAQVAYEQMK